MDMQNIQNEVQQVLHNGRPYNNVYYDSSNYKADKYDIGRMYKHYISNSAINFESTDVTFPINSGNLLVDHIIAEVKINASGSTQAVLNRLPCRQALNKIKFQIGQSNQEVQDKYHSWLSQMNQCATKEQRDRIVANEEIESLTIAAGSNATYYSILNLPWSKVTRDIKRPVDMQMLQNNMLIQFDLGTNAQIYSQGGSGITALNSLRIFPLYKRFINPNESMKLVSMNQSTGILESKIYSYPINYEKAYTETISSTGAQSVDLKSFIPGRINSILVALFTSEANMTAEQLTAISLTWNADVQSQFDGKIYGQVCNAEKKIEDIYTINSVNSYFYEIPLSQYAVNMKVDDYKYAPNFLNQTLKLNFTNSSTGTLKIIYNYSKFLVFDGVTANIV